MYSCRYDRIGKIKSMRPLIWLNTRRPRGVLNRTRKLRFECNQYKANSDKTNENSVSFFFNRLNDRALAKKQWVKNSYFLIVVSNSVVTYTKLDFSRLADQTDPN